MFGSKGSNGGSDPFGKAYTEYSGKPGEAIDKLLKEKSGHVPAAIHKEGIGDIDFVYGEAGEKGSGSGYGLAHIVRRRNEEGNDGNAFVKGLPEMIKNGKVYQKEGYEDRMYIGTQNEESAIRLTWDGKERNWLVSSYIKRP